MIKIGEFSKLVQVPVANNATVAPLVPPVTQTKDVREVKPTARPEVAAALSVKPLCVITLSTRGANEIVWDALSTENDCVTDGAAANAALPC